MNTQNFLAEHLEAARRRFRELDQVRDQMAGADFPPDCIDFVLRRLAVVSDKCSPIAKVKRSLDTADLVREAEQFFWPIIGAHQLELIGALVVIWQAGPESVARMEAE